MNKTKDMKKLYKSLMAVAASLLLIPNAIAQRNIPYTEKDGFGYNKYIVSDTPNENGEYTVRIETFLTGEVEMKNVSLPSDIILVLDASGSMNEAYNIGMRVPEDLVSAGTVNVTYNAFDTEQVSTNGWRWIRYPYNTGNYYRIHRLREQTYVPDPENPNTKWYYYFYYFDVEENGTTTRYWLDLTSGTASADNPGIVTEKPYTVHDVAKSGDYGGKQVWKGILYKYPPKVKVMREAVSEFIDMIAANSDTLDLKPGEIGNRIAVVRFATEYPTTDAFQADSLIELNSGSKTTVLKHFYEVSAVTGSQGKTNAGNLKSAVNNMSISGNTSVDQGFNLARMLLKSIDAETPAVVDGVKKRNRTIVLFTDGEPNGNGGFAGAVKRTIDIANELKASSDDAAPGEDAYDAKVFTVGVWPSATAATKLKWDLYMGHVSSNYPKAGYTSGNLTQAAHYTDAVNPPLANEDERIFYMDSSQPGFDLKKVFKAIAEYAGGENKGVGEESLMLDMISDSFSLPEGMDISKISVYTAQCLGELDEVYVDSTGTEKHYLAFAEPVPAKSRLTLDSLWVNVAIPDSQGRQPYSTGWVPTFQWEKKLDVSVDGNISFTFNETTEQVSVTGFNYADLWCGHDAEHQSAEQYDQDDYQGIYKPRFRGFKLILEFPIVAKSDALGGMDVPTNKPESGLYLTDASGKPTTSLLYYPKPALPIPVNLWIEKRGLKEGESANFTILRKLVYKTSETDPDPEYENFTKLLITGAPNDAPVVVKLLNLDPRYFYKIKEEGWSWSYTNQAQDLDTAPSTETITTNPIVIENTYNDPDIKHAEAVKRNEMFEY